VSTKKQIPLELVISIGLLIAVVAGFWLLVKPKRAEASSLDDEIANVQSQIQSTRVALARPLASTGPKIRVADLFRLAKAMPDTDDMSGIILEVNSVAESAGIRFAAIEPQPIVSGSTFHGLPMKLTFDGSYFDLADFLFRLRNLVTVRHGELDASGRLYTLDGMDLHESADGFPQVEAVLTITAYAYGTGGALGIGAPAAPSEPATDTTATTPAATSAAATTAPAATTASDGTGTPTQPQAPPVPRVDGHQAAGDAPTSAGGQG
jgi:Tfp pilus assembly protein PilO